MSTRAGTSLSPTPWIRRIQRRKKKQSASSQPLPRSQAQAPSSSTRAPSAAVKKEVVPSEEEVLELGRMVVQRAEDYTAAPSSVLSGFRSA